MINLIAAVSKNGVIGLQGGLPWNLPEDMKYFKEKTTHQIVIMGRKTFESLPKVLPNRLNVIISRNPDYEVPVGCMVFTSLEEALDTLKVQKTKEIFIIGGEQIFQEALDGDFVDTLYLTHINYETQGDTYLPVIKEGRFKEVYNIPAKSEDFYFAAYEKPETTANLRAKAERIGHYSMALYLKKRNYLLEHTHFIIFGESKWRFAIS